jgi:hypothetical protein
MPVPEQPGAPRMNAPTQTPSASGSPARQAKGGGCGTFDVPCKIREAINGWFTSLARSAINPVIRAMGTSVMASARVDQIDRVRELWSASAAIANTCYVVLVMAAGFLLLSHGSVHTSYTVKEVAPRLVLGFIASNMSLIVIGKAIEIANGLSAALMAQGIDPEEAAKTLSGLLVKRLLADLVTGPLFGILVLVVVVLALIVLATYAVRIMLLTLLTAAAPLGLACHALPQTDGLARLWWRALIGVLAVQVAQSLVLITALRVFFSSNGSVLFGAFPDKSGLLDIVLVICLLYILIRIPTWVRAMVFRGGRGSMLGRLVRTAATIAIFRGVLGRAGAGRAAGAARGMSGLSRALPELGASQPLPPELKPLQGQRWTQPQLPLQWPGSPRGTQQELFTVPASARRSRYTQMPLPLRDKPATTPRWEQTELPIRTRYEQLKLPMATPRHHTQPSLPLNFPERGTPQAGTPRPPNPAVQLHMAQLQKNQRERELRELRDRVRRDHQQRLARQNRRGGGRRKGDDR